MKITNTEFNQLKQLIIGYYSTKIKNHEQLMDLLKLVNSHKKRNFILTQDQNSGYMDSLGYIPNKEILGDLPMVDIEQSDSTNLFYIVE